jgi:peptidoglycan/xylan/chitin deacetylase (PgdA/CDA1 family)
MSPIIGTVFMLHRVCDYKSENLVHNENLKFSPEELEMVIDTLKRSNHSFVSLDRLVEIIQNGEKLKSKIVAFTLDDGYRDNLEIAYPIFRRHQIPFCIYVTNSFPNRTASLWWFALGRLILDNVILTLPTKRIIDNRSRKAKEKNFLTIRETLLKEHFRDPITFLKSLGDLRFDLAAERNRLCLSWDEIVTLSNDPLVTIGCHTINHYPLSRLSRKEVEWEISASKKELEEKTGKTVRHFAFPFGSRREATPREYDLAKAMGFNSITTTVHGHIHRSADVQKLDRIFLYPISNNRTTLDRIMYWNVKTLVSWLSKVKGFAR